MNIAMTRPERDLLESFLRCTRRYFEFGSGGSTYLAASLAAETVTSVDSSTEWLEQVRLACATNTTKIQPELVYANIGKIGGLGYPANQEERHLWPNYYTALWSVPKNHEADFYLVDGRFRVACFLQITLHCSADAFIAIHDFANRPNYHVIREVAREIAVAETFSVFVRRRDYNRQHALSILGQHAFEPA